MANIRFMDQITIIHARRHTCSNERIVWMVRRSSVVVSVLFGALVFREKNLRSKTVDLLLVILGMVFLYLGSR